MENLRAQCEELKEKKERNSKDLRAFLTELECWQKMNGDLLRMYAENLSLTEKKLENYDLEIAKCKREFEIEKQQICDDGKAKVEQLTENYKDASLLAEMQMEARCRDIEENWKLRLDELEKTNAKLNDTLSSTMGELNELKEHHGALKENMVQVLKDKNLYEMTINKTHKTVEALKQRLLKSDKDGKQLKAKSEVTESSKIEYEGKCNQMMEELEIVCGLCDDKEEQNCLALQLCQQRVDELERELVDKVDLYELEKTTGNLNDAMELIQELIDEQGAEREPKEMGHQNQKQKIKYLCNLKQKYHELLQGNSELEKVVRKQTRTIESLRKELTIKSPKLMQQRVLENKENVKSPNCSRNLLVPAVDP